MNHGQTFASWEAALASRQSDVLGAHAYRCDFCRGWHVGANVARDWANEPLGSKRGPKAKGDGLLDYGRDE